MNLELTEVNVTEGDGNGELVVKSVVILLDILVSIFESESILGTTEVVNMPYVAVALGVVVGASTCTFSAVNRGDDCVGAKVMIVDEEVVLLVSAF